MANLNLDKLHVSFDPPPWKKPRRRRRAVTLIDERGRLLVGITVRYPKGEPHRIDIPDALMIFNRPEHGNEKLLLSELDREMLRMKVHEKLRTRPDPPGHPERADAREQIALLRKAWATRSGRRN